MTGVRCRGGIHYGRIERKLSIARTDFPWKNGGIATMTAETNGSLEPDKDCTSESSMELRFEDLAETVIPGQGLVELRESTELTGWHKVWPVQPDGK